LKALLTTSKSHYIHQLNQLFKHDDFVFGDSYQNKFPSENTVSFAHEVLSFCLDQEIQKIYAVREGELNSLSEAKVLFAEFGIEIVLPNLNQNFTINNFYATADDFSTLSSQLLSAGYPNQKLALGKADLKGDLLIIDDGIKDFHQVFSKLEAVSFLQLGKLFNQPNFEKLNIYQINEGLNTTYIFIENYQTQFFEYVDASLSLVIDLMLKQNNCLGFYQVCYSGHQILRLKNIAL
jgi:hypothetical protein